MPTIEIGDRACFGYCRIWLWEFAREVLWGDFQPSLRDWSVSLSHPGLPKALKGAAPHFFRPMYAEARGTRPEPEAVIAVVKRTKAPFLGNGAFAFL